MSSPYHYRSPIDTQGSARRSPSSAPARTTAKRSPKRSPVRFDESASYPVERIAYRSPQRSSPPRFDDASVTAYRSPQRSSPPHIIERELSSDEESFDLPPRRLFTEPPLRDELVIDLPPRSNSKSSPRRSSPSATKGSAISIRPNISESREPGTIVQLLTLDGRPLGLFQQRSRIYPFLQENTELLSRNFPESSSETIYSELQSNGKFSQDGHKLKLRATIYYQ